MIKSKENCNSYRGCVAPMCPLDERLENLIWYPSEPVCNARGLEDANWRRIQRRINRVADMTDGYFTVADLRKIKAVRKGIKGRNPERRSFIR